MTTQFFPKTNTYDSNDMVIDEAAKNGITRAIKPDKNLDSL